MVQSSRTKLRGRVLDVEQFLIWVYRDQRAHVVTASGAGLHDLERHASGQIVAASTPTAQVARTLELGAMIAGSGAASVSGVLHRDAELAHGAVELMPRLARELILRHAVAGTRPDWMPTARHRFTAVIKRATGAPLIERAYDRNRNLAASWCVVSEIDPPVLVEASRDAYELWRGWLVELVPYLNARLTEHRLTPAPIPARPWQTAAERLAS